MSLLKAYLKGHTDPVLLAKAYYEDMVYKSVEAVEKLIAEELTFDMDKDMKVWNQEIKETQDEIKFWKGLYNDVSNSDALKILFGIDPVMERTTQAMSEEEGTPEEVETIPYSEIPPYVKELEGHIKNVQANINDAIEEYNETVKRITEMDADEFKEGKRKWPEEVYIRIHELGLNYIESKLDSYKERFEILKESGEIPQIRPKKLNAIDKKVETQLKRWKKLGRDKRPSYRDRQEILYGITNTLSIDSPEWRYKYYEDLINEWEVKKKRSIKELDEYKRKDEKEPYVPETPKERKDSKTDRSKLDSKSKGNLFYSDEEWWKQLSNQSKNVSSRKAFQEALGKYFKDSPSSFDVPVIAGNKTKTGIGEIQVEGGEAKYIKETPATKLANLKKLYAIFEKLPEGDRDRNVKIIMDGLQEEIEQLDLTVSSGKEDKLTFKEQGKKILKLLVTELDKFYNSIRDADESKPQRAISALNAIKGTGLKLNELKTFAMGKVTIKSLVDSNDRDVRDRAVRLLQTFDGGSPDFRKVVEKLTRPIKSQDDTVIVRLEKHWDDDDIQSISGKSKEEQQALNRIYDELLGRFEEVLDEIEGADVQIAEPDLDNKIEETLEQMQMALESIQESLKQTEMEFEGTALEIEDNIDNVDEKTFEDMVTEDALDWFIDTYEKFQEQSWEVLRRLNRDDEDFIEIQTLRRKIMDEIKKLPQLQGLIELDDKAWKKSHGGIMEERRLISERLQGQIAMAGIEGSQYSKLKDVEYANKYVDASLPMATTQRGITKRQRLIKKILDNKELKNSDFDWDVKQTSDRRKQMVIEIDEEYDEADVGQRETEELIEGGEEEEFDIGELSGRYESER